MNISLNESFFGTSRILYVLPSVLLVTPLGVPSNVLVLRALVGKPGICSTPEIFTASQALMDLAFCVGLFAEVVYTFVVGSVSLLSVVFNQFGGPLHLVCACVDTYLGVLHPVCFMRLKAPVHRVAVCTCLWVITTGFFISSIFSKDIWFLVISLLAVDLVVINFCLIQVLWTLNQPGPGGTKVHPVKKRAFNTVLTLFILTLVHYSLPVVNYAVAQTSRPSHEFRPLTVIACTLQSLSSCVKPILFLVKANKLPSALTCQTCQA